MTTNDNSFNEREDINHVYFGFEGLQFSDDDRIMNLVREDPWLASDFSEYCVSRKVQDPNLNTLCAWVGDGIGSWKYWAGSSPPVSSPASLKYAVAAILSSVIRSQEDINIIGCYFDLIGEAGLGIEPSYPWDMNDRSKALTREEAEEIIRHYIGLAADDTRALY